MSDIVERLREPIIADAFEEGRITDGCLADRLVRDRHDASDEIERLIGRVTELEHMVNSDEAQLQHYAYEAMKAQEEIERLRAEREALRKQVASVELVMKEVRGWANDAGSTKTPRGRTLNAVLRRLREALKGKQAARALLQKGK
jgi:chromosome segregation ATPase